MKLFGRQDFLLIAALTTALIIVFSSSISRLLDYAREIERQSGLTLMPALVLLTVVYFIHQFRRRNQMQAQADAAQAATREAQHRADELERLVQFGQSLGNALDFDSIRVSIGQHLPALAGTDRVWVLVRQGTQWEALSDDTRGAKMRGSGATWRSSCWSAVPTRRRTAHRSRDRVSADRRRHADGRARDSP